MPACCSSWKALERAAEIQPPDKPPVGALGGEIRLQGHAEGNDGSRQELSLWAIYLREPDEYGNRGNPDFRGTLKYNTFIATLQLVNRLCDVAIYLTDSELHAMSWSDFTAGITEPELIQYLKERRLYLNEPVESEAEL